MKVVGIKIFKNKKNNKLKDEVGMAGSKSTQTRFVRHKHLLYISTITSRVRSFICAEMWHGFVLRLFSTLIINLTWTIRSVVQPFHAFELRFQGQLHIGAY